MLRNALGFCVIGLGGVVAGESVLLAQVVPDCFDCTRTDLVKTCNGGAFDWCDQSVVVGDDCLEICADACSPVVVRWCPERVSGDDAREIPSCADWGSTQLFALCLLRDPEYPCSCDFNDPNAVLALYPCALAVPLRSVRSCQYQ
jgi:hypothetical protein